MNIELYDGREQALRDRLKKNLRKIDPDMYATCRLMEAELGSLSRVFCSYPSILDNQHFGDEIHSVDTLIERLFRDGCDHTVLLPTKVMVGRTFTVAKFNFFGFLRKICSRYEGLARYDQEVQEVWEHLLFSLLIEDVYQVIIERNGYYSPELRREAALELIHLWEYRFDQTVTDYAPAVVELWRARLQIAPVFGTMMGTMELMRLSSLLSDRWYRFLDEQGEVREVQQALEEFVFGIVHEEICLVRETMDSRGIAAVNRESLQEMLAREVPPEPIQEDDPREMYRFYHRRSRKILRRRIAGAEGPRRTLEEILLVFLMNQRLAAGLFGPSQENPAP
ncbi:hypothetical protein [Alkalispirochaeta alkalica]|uniref:hypothetical protein n=1 Tax=Alkalispirochaeta alkalica TaxID=46356 RepID=UPI00037F30E6|nr:hypothetical protein [Alkalispirochaeta alkalica]